MMREKVMGLSFSQDPRRKDQIINESLKKSKSLTLNYYNMLIQENTMQEPHVLNNYQIIHKA